MKGSVFKRGATWCYVVDVGMTPEGKRRQQKRGGFGTRKDAERALRAVLHAIDRGRFVDPTQQTLAGYLREEWLPAMQPPRLSDATWAGYRWELENRVIPRLGASKLQELNGAHINHLYATLLREGGRGGAPLSPRSVQYVHAILRKALDDAVSWGLLAHNPAARAQAPTQRAVTRGRPDLRTWSADELATFLAHVADDRLYAGWVLTAMTGMRRGEVLGLRWQDVDLAARRLAVRQTLVMVSGRPKPSRPKTPKSRRTIDLDRRTVAALRSWKATQDRDRLRWGPAWKGRGLVLTREDGGVGGARRVERGLRLPRRRSRPSQDPPARPAAHTPRCSWPRARRRRSSASGSATPRSPSHSTPTRMRCRGCRRKPPTASQGWCSSDERSRM